MRVPAGRWGGQEGGRRLGLSPGIRKCVLVPAKHVYSRVRD